MLRYCRVASLLVAAALLAGCGNQTFSFSDPAPAPPPVNNQQVVGVSGTHMTLNGSPWLSRGVVLQAFVRPLAALESDPTEAARLNARRNYGQAELDAIRGFHADTIRFQIGQPALAPSSPLYDPSYLNEVVNAIKTARQAGFVVMIMMQDEAISGETTPHPLPLPKRKMTGTCSPRNSARTEAWSSSFTTSRICWRARRTGNCGSMAGRFRCSSRRRRPLGCRS